MKLKLIVAAVSVAMAGSAVAGPLVFPGGDLGLQDKFPDSFASLKLTTAITPFVDSFKFSLGTKSEVIGSGSIIDFGSAFGLGYSVGALQFTGLTFDGLAPTISGTDFSIVLGAGTHVMSFSGLSYGLTGYTGSIYATAVPEPESLALALAGMGVTVSVMRRRSRT